MKSGFFLIITLVILVSCYKKTIPVIIERKQNYPKEQVNTLPSETILPDTIAGKSIFIARCDRCHGLPEPTQYSKNRWERITIPFSRFVWYYVPAHL